MSNESMTNQSNGISDKIRTSVIRKSIKRTVNTGQYETLVIEDGIEEIVEWSTLEERNRKVDNWEKILLQKYKTSHDKILDELGFSHKKAYFSKSTDDTSAKFAEIKNKDTTVKKKNDLDMMDTL